MPAAQWWKRSASEAALLPWKRADDDFVDSRCGRWSISPIYGGLTRPESYELRRNVSGEVGGWKVVGSGQTQGECKWLAVQILLRERHTP